MPGGCGGDRSTKAWQAVTHVFVSPSDGVTLPFNGVAAGDENGALLSNAADCPAGELMPSWVSILQGRGVPDASAAASTVASSAAASAGAGAGGHVALDAAMCDAGRGSEHVADVSSDASTARLAALKAVCVGGIDHALPTIADWLAAPQQLPQLYAVFEVSADRSGTAQHPSR